MGIWKPSDFSCFPYSTAAAVDAVLKAGWFPMPICRWPVCFAALGVGDGSRCSEGLWQRREQNDVLTHVYRGQQ